MTAPLVAAGSSALAQTTAPPPAPTSYPQTKKVDQVDDYFGTKVADPYRWLEDDNAADTKAWVEAQNAVTFGYLSKIAGRDAIKQRLTTLWNYERYGLPRKRGAHYVFTRNDGLQNQAVYYRAASLDATPEVLLDPNTLSGDGTVAVGGTTFSDDGRYMAYSLSESGSDWIRWKVREVATGKDLPDEIRWSKFSGAAWLHDGSGFFYSRYDAPKEGAALTGVNKDQKVYFHKLGTSQDADPLVYARPDKPDWGLGADVTDDGKYLLIYQTEGTDPKNRIFVKDLTKADAKVEPFLDQYDASYNIVGNDGATFYVLTNQGAPRKRLVAITLGQAAPSAWKTLIPEGPKQDVLDDVTMAADRFVATWQIDAQNKLRIYGRDGAVQSEVALPTIGAVSFSGRREQAEGYYAFSSFAYPTAIFRLDVATGRSTIFKQPKVAFDPAQYETTQVFYPSKDGTRIPMFITHRKGLARSGANPTYLYGYGGFDISLTPSFSPANLAWMEMGGVYAVANLRGGGEYGKAWHDAGRLKNKQNVFDDFIAAAEYLIGEKYTSTPKLAIGGGSNGGLLVGAAMTQRPDLFGAALPAVGVMDMLRFHRFTIGWAWKSDYGSSETKEGFDVLYKYSPLHNLKPGTAYPATMVTTADHDDRVVPAHSFKFAAALQAAHKGPQPVLIRIETKAGHGAGKPTSKQIEEAADKWAFLKANLGF
ncbi:prolyl oligopeptidase family protein [Luteitalea sp. TBR-22]|uniref:prolyl oligopeptidase family serine peptidase n=1 Tax=Luteitalea sp. TBR-22 TaxID=2802971 RepID=UPI001EF4E4D9|nr:prolyl oligopeptidase family serine peptidase [Luteitalea sp. TBR-22]